MSTLPLLADQVNAKLKREFRDFSDFLARETIFGFQDLSSLVCSRRVAVFV